MSDITTRLRQTRADMIGTDDEQHYWDCHDAAAEIERLRTQPCPYVVGRTTLHCSLTPLTLTDEEREAISAAACICEDAGRTDIAIIVHTALSRLG